MVSVFLDGEMELLMTRSWDFLCFASPKRDVTIESDMIIGVIDSGIWPESESFSDHELGPPPAKWKGICQTAPDFSSNNKIIRARFYLPSNSGETNLSHSPRDFFGHGTHVAATVAGAATTASLFGYARETARGGVPSARLAVYKVCWEHARCGFASILNAFDDAIADGVDIISVSLGYSTQLDYLNNPIAIGSFHAMTNEILTVIATGNDGPLLGTISNFAPWSIDVAASNIDRRFNTKVLLGNKTLYEVVHLFKIPSCMELKNFFYKKFRCMH